MCLVHIALLTRSFVLRTLSHSGLVTSETVHHDHMHCHLLNLALKCVALNLLSIIKQCIVEYKSK